MGLAAVPGHSGGKKMLHSEAVDKIIPALVEAQAHISLAKKDATNEFFKNAKYADLASVWLACRDPLAKNGLYVCQDVILVEIGVSVTTRIWHTSGQWIEFGPLVVPIAKRDAHGVGSATTYAKRYGLSAALGVVSDDDDGNGATGKSEKDGKGFIERMPGGTATKETVSPPPPPPGISAVRADVNNAIRDINSATDADTLMAFLNTPSTKKLAVKVFHEFPSLWVGPEDDSGLKGMILKVAREPDVGALADAESYVRRVEESKPPQKKDA